MIGSIVLPKIGLLDISVLAAAAAYLVIGGKFRITKTMSITLGTLFILVFLSLLSSVSNQTLNFEYITRPVRIGLLLAFGVGVFSRLDENEPSLFRIVAIAGALNGVVVFAQIIMISRGMDYSALRMYPAGMTEGGFRAVGLAAGYPASGLLSCMAALICLYLYLQEGGKRYLMLLVMAMPGVFFSARTALIMFIAIAPLLSIRLNLKRLRLRTFIVIGAALVMGAAFYWHFQSNDAIERLLYIMFENVHEYNDTGSLNIHSTQDLLTNNYFVPDSIGDWLIGSAKSAWGVDGIPSDVWFVQVLNGSGIFALILYLFLFAYLFGKSLRGANLRGRHLLFIVCAITFVASFKGAYIFSRFVGDVPTMFFASYLARQAREARANTQDQRPQGYSTP